MDNLKVSLGSDAPKLKRQRSEDDVSVSPKFKARQVSAARDFPLPFKRCNEHIEQKSEEDHVCDVDDGNCVEPFIPHKGTADIEDDEDVEPTIAFHQESALPSVFADAEFVEQIEFSECGSEESVRSTGGSVNKEEEDSMVDDEAYPEPRDMPCASRASHRTLPKRRKVSAIRDFPDAFLQCEGENDLPKKAIHSANASADEFGEGDGDSDLEDDTESLETEFGPLRNTADIEFDLASKCQKFERQDTLLAVDEEKVLQFAADNLDYWDEAESITPLDMLDLSDVGEEEDSVNSFTVSVYYHSEDFGKIETRQNAKLENDGGDQNFINQLEVLEELKIDNMVVDGAYDQLDDKQTNPKNCLGMIPKRNKVFAVRDFPDAFTESNARKIAAEMEGTDDEANSLLLSTPVSPKMYLPDGQASSTKSCQGGDLGSEKAEHRIIVQAMMAASRCPWSSKKTRGLDSSLANKQTSIYMCPGMLPKRSKVSAVRDFPDGLLESNARKGTSNSQIVAAEKDGAYHLEDDEDLFETYLESSRYLVHTETDGFSYNEELHWDNALLALDKEESLPFRFDAQATQKEASFYDHSGILGHEIINVIDSSRDAYKVENTDDGASSQLLSTRVSPKMYLPEGQVSSTKSFQGRDVASEKTEHRIIVQALMAAPRCPWSSKTTRGLVSIVKYTRHEPREGRRKY